VTVCNNDIFNSKDFINTRTFKPKLLNQVNLSNSLVRNIKFYNRCLSRANINLLGKLTKPAEIEMLDVHQTFYEELRSNRFNDVTCDGCESDLNLGLRFKCATGCDFDLCYRCFSNGNNPSVQPHLSTHTWFRVLHHFSQQDYYCIQIPKKANTLYFELIPYQLLSTLPITLIFKK